MRYILIAVACCHALAVHGATRHVAASGGHNPPFTNWVDAATNIQNALEVSADADIVLVSNGIYELSAQVSITNGVTLRSVNGAESTIIDGKHVTRCLYLAHSNAFADGFTLRNGSNGIGAGVFIKNAGTIRNSIVCSNTARVGGGGVRCEGGGLVESCVIMGNVSFRDSTSGGGGRGASCSFGGTIRNCLIANKLACDGGGVRCAWGGNVQNCTVVGNTATNLGGGLFLISGAQWGGNPALVENSIVAYNSASGGADHYSLGINNSLTYCCFDGSLIAGDGNIDAPAAGRGALGPAPPGCPNPQPAGPASPPPAPGSPRCPRPPPP